jgi:hypothetical protein
MTDAPLLSFIVPVRDAADHLRRCLDSIRACTADFPAEVIVVDNGSSDDSVSVALASGARVLSMPGRVAELRNAASHVATGAHLAFVDADHEIDIGWAQAALELLRDPTVSAVGAQYRAPVEGTWVQRMYDRLRRHASGCRDVGWLPSGNLVVRKDHFEAIGGFDTTLHTCEDVDFCQRLTAAGNRLLSADRLRSIHRGDPGTLKALFFGELWRGRDNLRVSVRSPLTLRTLPGIVFPIANLFALAAVIVGLSTLTIGGGLLVVGGTLSFASAVGARTGALLWQPQRSPLNLAIATQAIAVAGVYETARALALVARMGHELRRKG